MNCEYLQESLKLILTMNYLDLRASLVLTVYKLVLMVMNTISHQEDIEMPDHHGFYRYSSGSELVSQEN